MSGTDPAVLADEELLHSILPAIRADYRAAETHRYQAGPTPVVPDRCPERHNGSRGAEAEAAAWSTHTTAACTFHSYPGGHFCLNDHAMKVIELIRERIA